MSCKDDVPCYLIWWPCRRWSRTTNLQQLIRTAFPVSFSKVISHESILWRMWWENVIRSFRIFFIVLPANGCRGLYSLILDYDGGGSTGRICLRVWKQVSTCWHRGLRHKLNKIYGKIRPFRVILLQYWLSYCHLKFGEVKNLNLRKVDFQKKSDNSKYTMNFTNFEK